jgi:hypothetical protein
MQLWRQPKGVARKSGGVARAIDERKVVCRFPPQPDSATSASGACGIRLAFQRLAGYHFVIALRKVTQAEVMARATDVEKSFLAR